jgi:hypothetical protein
MPTCLGDFRSFVMSGCDVINSDHRLETLRVGQRKLTILDYADQGVRVALNVIISL